VASLVSGVALLAAFVRIELTAEEPILPMRLLANRMRAGANVARGLGYAGMYGMIFFLTQFLQDVQHHSSLVTGLGFLPTPTTVFLTSQLTSRVLINRYPAKTLMLFGSGLTAAGLLLATQLHASTPYIQVLATLVLIGAGMGTSFVSLTTAALHDVAPQDSGAASGLINVMQQLGAALGLAVLVTVFDRAAGGAGLIGRAANTATIVHGIDVTFAAGAIFALAALAMVALLVRSPKSESLDLSDLDLEEVAVEAAA
jgi:MFS family permease